MERFRHDGTVDIGIDAPLDQTGRVRPLDEGHRVSLRWFTGALLTGLAGAAMMGGAVLGTMDAVSSTSQVTVAANATREIPSGPATRSVQKQTADAATVERQDRLIKPVDIALAKRSFSAQAMMKSGDREILQTRKYTRVSAPLEAFGSAGRNIPRFNPMILISEANTNRNFNSVTLREDPNADVSISTSELAASTAAQAPFSLEDSAAEAQATESLTEAGGASVAHSPLTMLERVMNERLEQPSPDLIAFTPLPGSPFSKLEVRLVPENFVEIAKLGGDELAMRHREDVTVIDKGGSAAAAITARNVNAKVAKAAEQALVKAVGKEGLAPGNRLKLRFALSKIETGRAEDLVNVTLYSDDRILSVIGRRDDGGFDVVPLTESPDAETSAGGDRLTVYASIYETALRQDVPRALVDELVRVYSYDVDFQRPVTPSDSIDFLYAEPEQGSVEQGELLFVSIDLGGETKNYFRFQSGDADSVDFYDPQGRSGRKFLLRMPLPSGELRSGFGWRRHPILGYMKMHTGVDWSNKVGTPILAAGNGIIRKAAWDTGYGRRVEIEHANGYITTYSHMSGFGDGVAEGVRVRQGQVIGYLGTSGLSTGPHLHYEVIVNDNFLDPMAIKLPRGKELDGKELVAFRQEKTRIEGLIGKSFSASGPELAASAVQ